ncbi:MAG: efflux RND transporter periplasmic adaptor subunit [Rhodospirillales bacterium]|nr:efflux RND transporter periplasmic adaptor subunit [Rhodospirillales bacterium]
MKKFRLLLSALGFVLTFLLFFLAAQAHEGESHDTPKGAASLSTRSTETGYSAEGDIFQVVLLPQGKHSRLYLADGDSNAPVAGAVIEAESGNWKGSARPTKEAGLYDLDWAPTGAQDLTLAVSAAGKDDLILLAIKDTAKGPVQTKLGSKKPNPSWLTAAGIGAAFLMGGGIVLIGRRRLPSRAGAILAAVLASSPAFAHGGEDHGNAPEVQAPTTVGAPLALAKSAQFLLGIRTIRVEPREAADTVRVVGRVVPDPDGFARVQSSQPARVISDSAIPFPIPGRAVRRGQALMVLEPTLTSLERSDKRASLYRVESEIAIQERELARQEALAGVVPAKLPEQTRIRLDQLRKERTQLAGTALGRETLIAPVEGTITDVHVVPGEIVGTDKVVVELVDPNRLRIDAVVHDLALAERITGAVATTRLVPDETFELSLLGVSPRVDPVDQGVHAQFTVASRQAKRLKLGMPVDVYLQTGAARLGLAVPREALTEFGGRKVVFVRTEPERFEARPVRIGRIVGSLAEIVEGLANGDRVVVQGVEQIKAVR